MFYFEDKLRVLRLKKFLIENNIYNSFIQTICSKDKRIYEVLMSEDYFNIFTLYEFTASSDPVFWENISKKWRKYYVDCCNQILLHSLSLFLIEKKLHLKLIKKYYNPFIGFFIVYFLNSKRKKEILIKLLNNLLRDKKKLSVVLEPISNKVNYVQLFIDECFHRKKSYILKEFKLKYKNDKLVYEK